jgi:hypothetical protein
MPAGAVVLVHHLFDSGLPQPGSIEVYECAGKPTEYILNYAIDIADNDILLLRNSALGPDSDLSILAQAGNSEDCLVRGPVYAQKIRLVHGGERSVLSVLGSDKCVQMDRESKATVFPAGRASEAVTRVLEHFDLTPDIEQTDGLYSENTHFLVQRETDYEFVERMARHNGFLFGITTEAAAPGRQTAHFKRPVLEGTPSGTIQINRKDGPNVPELTIDWNIQTAVSTSVRQLDPFRGHIDGSLQQSTLTALGDTPLANIVTGPSVRHVAAPGHDQGILQGVSEGLLLESTFFVEARCEISTTAAGMIFRPHTLIQVAGAGTRHSGLYYCSAVRHTISDTEHMMQLELLRNAWNQ